MMPLTRSALAYLADLEHAVDLAMHHREAAEITERGHWMMHRRQFGSESGEGGACNSATAVVDSQIYTDTLATMEAARTRVGFVAWWYTTAALAALRAVLAGTEITARRLEELTLQGPGQEERAKASFAWQHCLLPDLPRPGKLGELGELQVGEPRLDTQLQEQLAELVLFYASAGFAQDLDEDEPLSDSEAGLIGREQRRAASIPERLIEYARTVHEAAVYASRKAQHQAAGQASGES